MPDSEPVVDLLDSEWKAISQLGSELDDSDWALPSECPGWSVKDLVSHMIGTERSLLGDPEPPPAPPAAHIRNPVGQANEAWVEERRATPGSSVLAEFIQVTRKRAAELRALPPERFEVTGPSPVGNVPYREFMSVRVMDCWVHEQDMRVAGGRPCSYGTEAAAMALARLVSAMPFVVGKRAGAPDGSSVRFALNGGAPQQIDVVVTEGRAALVSTVEPTATLTMDTDDFWRLCCGRVEGQAVLDAGLVALDGDLELGSAVIRSMAFMI